MLLGDAFTTGASGMLNLRKLREETAMYPETLRYQNMLNRAKAGMADIDYQNYPETAQAELAYKKLLPPYLQTQTNLLGEQAKYYGPKARADIENQEWINRGLAAVFPYLVPKEKASIRSTELTNEGLAAALPYAGDKAKAELEKIQEENKWIGPKAKAEINYRNMGGGMGMGVGGKEERFFQNLVARDNPQLTTPEQIYEASNVLRNGGDQLADGTKLNAMSPATRASFDRIVRYGTTAPLLTGNARAKQAEAEIQVLNDYAQKGLAPYGDTYANMSPQQIVDSFSNKKDKQLQLGRLIAAQAIQYEIAQNRIRLANGQPGVTSTEELMKLSGQTINTKFPKLTYVARQEAARYLDEALKEGLNARLKVGVGASQVNGGNAASNNQPKAKKTAPLGMVRVVAPDGRTGSIPTADLEKALKAGYKKED